MELRARLLALTTAALAVAGFALAAAYALGDDVIASSSTCCTYSAPSFTITGGQVAQFHNGTTGGIYGGTSHNVTATGKLSGRPLFASGTISGGQDGSVDGTQYLAPGDYTFFCTIHGPSMSATLHVVGGTPVARPSVDVAISSGKLAKVLRSGKLKVKVADSGSDASGVALTAKLGSKRIAQKTGVFIAAGADKQVGMKLPKAGLKALKGRDSAKVNLTATVPFGTAAKTARTLH